MEVAMPSSPSMPPVAKAQMLIRKPVTEVFEAMDHEPTIDWLLKNQGQVTHAFHQLALEGKL